MCRDQRLPQGNAAISGRHSAMDVDVVCGAQLRHHSFSQPHVLKASACQHDVATTRTRQRSETFPCHCGGRQRDSVVEAC
jgi:hypothetical protein